MHAISMAEATFTPCQVSELVPEKLTSLPSSLRSTCESKRSRYQKALLRA